MGDDAISFVLRLGFIPVSLTVFTTQIPLLWDVPTSFHFTCTAGDLRRCTLFVCSRSGLHVSAYLFSLARLHISSVSLMTLTA